jgi:hypothetical protein
MIYVRPFGGKRSKAETTKKQSEEAPIPVAAAWRIGQWRKRVDGSMSCHLDRLCFDMIGVLSLAFRRILILIKSSAACSGACRLRMRICR